MMKLWWMWGLMSCMHMEHLPVINFVWEGQMESTLSIFLWWYAKVKRFAAFVIGYDPVNIECLQGSHPITIGFLIQLWSSQTFWSGKNQHVCNISSYSSCIVNVTVFFVSITCQLYRYLWFCYWLAIFDYQSWMIKYILFRELRMLKWQNKWNLWQDFINQIF